MFVVIRRTDIPNGVLQIRDLWPNPSQYNPVLDPTPQGPWYLTNPLNETVSTLVSNADKRTLARTVSGLGAYILCTVAGSTVGGKVTTLTAAHANTIATNILTEMRSVTPELTLASLNAIINAVVAGSGIVGTKTSTARVVDILAILSGAVFTVSSGHQTQGTNGVFSPIATNDIDSYFTTEKYQRVITSDLVVSIAKGSLSVMLDNITYEGVTDKAVVVFNNDGTVYTP